MKIRKGFVSNSSSSSFCILGIVLNEEQQEILESDWKSTLVSTEYGISDYYDQQLIGAGPWKMTKHETLSQFTERIVEELNAIGINVKEDDVEWHIDGGYEG